MTLMNCKSWHLQLLLPCYSLDLRRSKILSNLNMRRSSLLSTVLLKSLLTKKTDRAVKMHLNVFLLLWNSLMKQDKQFLRVLRPWERSFKSVNTCRELTPSQKCTSYRLCTRSLRLQSRVLAKTRCWLPQILTWLKWSPICFLSHAKFRTWCSSVRP